MSEKKSYTVSNPFGQPVNIITAAGESILPPRYRGTLTATAEQAREIEKKGINLKEGK